MTAAVGLPTLRLIRTHIGDYSLWSHTEDAQTLTLGAWVWVDQQPSTTPTMRKTSPRTSLNKRLKYGKPRFQTK